MYTVGKEDNDMEKMLTGNEAIARGFYEAGGKIATSYPGSPTVQVLEACKQYDGVYGEFSTKHKTTWYTRGNLLNYYFSFAGTNWRKFR